MMRFQPPPFTQEGVPLVIRFHHKSKPYVIDNLRCDNTVKDLENEIKRKLHGQDDNGVKGNNKVYKMSYMGNQIIGDKKLIDFQLQGNIQINFHVASEGGTTKPKKISFDNDTRDISFKDHKDIPKVIGKCIMFGDKDELCAKMDCGCLVSPAGMRGIIGFILDSPKFPLIYCPICDSKKKKTIIWNYYKCLWIAGIKGENYTIISEVFFNREQDFNGIFKQCPNCLVQNKRKAGVNVFRINCNSCKKDFCFECSKSWKAKGMVLCGNKDCCTWEKQKALDNSPMLSTKDDKKNNIDRSSWLPRVDNKVPKIRACPKCWNIIEHLEKCPHIKCSACGYDFCWICLGYERGFFHSWSWCAPAAKQKLF